MDRARKSSPRSIDTSMLVGRANVPESAAGSTGTRGAMTSAAIAATTAIAMPPAPRIRRVRVRERRREENAIIAMSASANGTANAR